ncbi:hypothetical protein [Aureimonas sp. AU12]|uniref:hypothetical protein n=1 Tax=Aureimonas sp. AU12 TaxID=1638161 RepID=UPI0009EBB821|nr:hypothetical protein [Aureimonas sp. AU12]
MSPERPRAETPGPAGGAQSDAGIGPAPHDKSGTVANAEVDWSGFDPEAYFQHYYGEPHGDDDEVVRHAVRALMDAEPRDRSLDIVDVGTGPNLFPLLAALPRAARLTAFDYAAPNVAWLRHELQRLKARPQWRHFWDVVRSSAPGHDLPSDPMDRLRAIATVEQGSIFDLPARRFDAATMFFCAESITSRWAEFETACTRFAGCVRPGGSLIAAFLVGSSTYEVADRAFPVVRLDEAEIATLFRPLTSSLQTSTIGLTDSEVRSGYTGMVFLAARAA